MTNRISYLGMSSLSLIPPSLSMRQQVIAHTCSRTESLTFDSHTYGKHDGGYWAIYPEKVHDKWLEYYTRITYEGAQLEAIPASWTGLWKRPLTSFRFESTIPFPRPKLTSAEKDHIVETATSREHFHDIDKIVNAPGYGTCLCELRFITGTQCLQHLRKGPDGKTLPSGKDHWAWFIDINPRAMLCPHAKDNGLKSDGKRFHCDILIREPTEDWVLEQDPNDPQGTVAGRASSDLVFEGKCPRCIAKFNFDPRTKQLLNPDFSNPLVRPGPAMPQPYKEPPDNSMWAESGAFSPPPWERNLSIRPLMFQSEKGPDGRPLRDYHPLFVDNRYYHQKTFTDAGALWDAKDLIFDVESNITLAAHKQAIMDHTTNTILMADEQEERDFRQREEVARRQMAKERDDALREEVLMRIIADDNRQWY